MKNKILKYVVFILVFAFRVAAEGLIISFCWNAIITLIDVIDLPQITWAIGILARLISIFLITGLPNFNEFKALFENEDDEDSDDGTHIIYFTPEE